MSDVTSIVPAGTWECCYFRTLIRGLVATLHAKLFPTFGSRVCCAYVRPELSLLPFSRVNDALTTKGNDDDEVGLNCLSGA